MQRDFFLRAFEAYGRIAKPLKPFAEIDLAKVLAMTIGFKRLAHPLRPMYDVWGEQVLEFREIYHSITGFEIGDGCQLVNSAEKQLAFKIIGRIALHRACHPRLPGGRRVCVVCRDRTPWWHHAACWKTFEPGV